MSRQTTHIYEIEAQFGTLRFTFVDGVNTAIEPIYKTAPARDRHIPFHRIWTEDEFKRNFAELPGFRYVPKAISKEERCIHWRNAYKKHLKVATQLSGAEQGILNGTRCECEDIDFYFSHPFWFTRGGWSLKNFAQHFGEVQSKRLSTVHFVIPEVFDTNYYYECNDEQKRLLDEAFRRRGYRWVMGHDGRKTMIKDEK